jgi:hypothetical protein
MKCPVQMVSSGMKYITKFHDYRFRKASNIKVIISTISEAVMLVLLMIGIYEIRL